MGANSTAGGFDFWQFWHAMVLVCVGLIASSEAYKLRQTLELRQPCGVPSFQTPI
ncbi:hypothetical protein [Rubritalea tangerina]|uniref:hypothetical protein n=1 Tax=Rubritalea tangerina TaxID=430798 RepID=UPI00360F0F4D